MTPQAERQRMPEFTRTEKAAAVDKLSRWDLIAAIAEDADDAGVPITGGESQAATTRALEKVGMELASSTVKQLTVVAKFDWESMPDQRKVWRRYGWSVVDVLAESGFSPSAAAEFLDVPNRRTFAETKAEARRLAKTTDEDDRDRPDLSEAWAAWLTRAHALLADGAALEQRTEDEHPELDAEAGFARVAFQRMNERNFDTQLRAILDGGEVPSL